MLIKVPAVFKGFPYLAEGGACSESLEVRGEGREESGGEQCSLAGHQHLRPHDNSDEPRRRQTCIRDPCRGDDQEGR